MDRNTFEQRMRALEYFHSLRVLPGAWVVLRVDGRSFSRFTEAHYEKPFDPAFHALMLQTARTLLEELQGVYAYTESDEISILFRPEWKLFDREVEKLVSISAGIASATFTLASQQPAHFDSRLWLGVDVAQVIDYFCWRQADAARCALNGWCYWTLRKAGNSVAAATTALKKQSVAAKNELLFQHGINFNDVPAWQRRGSGLFWETYEKTGYDPIQQKEVTTSRRRIQVNEELLMKEGYGDWLRQIIASPSGGER